MPNRMLRDWTDSLRFEDLTAEAERLFVRLIMKADDYGRFHADPRLLKASCFPLIDTLRPNDLIRWLEELSTRQLILRYEADGRCILAILNYGQRLKSSKAKFPPFPGENAEWLPTSEYFQKVPGSSGKSPSEEKRREVEGEVETEDEGEAPTPPEGAGERVTSPLDPMAIVGAYPRREKTAEALEIVTRDLGNGENFAVMLAGTRACAEVIRTLPSAHLNRYVPSATAFFRSKRWRDDPQTMRRADVAEAPEKSETPGGVPLKSWEK